MNSHSLPYELQLDDIVLSDLNESTEQLQHLLNIDCALALSVCKSRNLPPCVFVLSLLYMKRLRALHSSSSLVEINDLTTKELYLIATLLANKYLIDEGEDEQLYNSEISELAGITIDRINLIERQVLLALNWNLYVSNDEFDKFYILFKNQMKKKFKKHTEQIQIDDPKQFYSLCFQYLIQIIECFALTSIVLLGSTISIMTAIHMTTITHSTLMKTLNPPVNCLHFPTCHEDTNLKTNTSLIQQKNIWASDKYSSILLINSKNDTFEQTQPIRTLIDVTSCSRDFNQAYPLYRPIVHAFG